MLFQNKLALAVLLSSTSAAAFSISSSLPRVRASQRSSTSSLNVAVDPEVVSKKEYEDICGIGFDEESMEKRLERTKFLYPKHVEVIEDFDSVVEEMVDKVVSLVHATCSICSQCEMDMSVHLYIDTDGLVYSLTYQLIKYIFKS